MTQIANELSKNSPRMIDEATRFDDVGVAGEDSLNFNYTLTLAAKDEINLTEFNETVTPYLLDSYKNTPEMEWFRAQGIKINHTYNDKNGERITIIVVGENL